MIFGVNRSWNVTKEHLHLYDIKGFDSNQIRWTSADQKVSKRANKLYRPRGLAVWKA
jgi:hypothetical protein